MTRAREIIALGILTAVLYAALAYALYIGVTSRVPGANDFYSRWQGARALFLRGQNPYSDAVTREIQIGMYGRLAMPNEDQVAFAYPLYSAFFAVPFVALSYPQAQGMWMAFLTLAVMGASLALTQVSQIKSLRFTMALMLGALVFYPSVRAIFNGQYAVVSFLFIVLAIVCVSSHHDTAAGLFIALSTVKPQTALFLAPVIVFWACCNRRWRIAVAAMTTFVVLVLVALLLVPTWIFDFAQGLRQYAQYEPVGPPLEIVVQTLVADLGWRNLAIVLCLIALFAWTAWRIVHTVAVPWENFLPTLGLVAIVTTIWSGRIGSSDQVLLLIPWLGWLGAWANHGKMPLAILFAVLVLVLPWIVFLATVRGNAENVAVSLILPFLSFAVFLWQKR